MTGGDGEGGGDGGCGRGSRRERWEQAAMVEM